MSDLASMLKQQMENNIAQQLDAAVQTGDTQAARRMAKQYADLQVASAPKGPAAKAAPTTDQIKQALTEKLDWFGIDPRKSAKMVELGKMMDPARFDTAGAFADALIKAYNDEEKAATAGSKSDDDADDSDDVADDVDGDDDDDTDDARQQRKPARRNGTQQPELGNSGRSNATGGNLRRAFETGDIKLLPRAAADEIKKSAAKLASAGDEKQKAAFIANAVKARARSELIKSGKFDARENKFK